MGFAALIPLIVAIINGVIQLVKFLEAHPEVGASVRAHIQQARTGLEASTVALENAADQRARDVQGP